MYNLSVKERQVENGTVLDIHGKLRGWKKDIIRFF
jgi:hypothetical protein